jgi:hypothetical protein
MSNAADTLSAEDEIDLSGDSAVEIVTAVWQITAAEVIGSESEKGTGSYVQLTFESQDFPFPLNMRFFTEYTSSDPSKNTDWVKRQRGQLKNIAKAATGEAKLVLNSDAEGYIVGKTVTATTKDGGDGFPQLGKFKKAE